MKKVITLLLIIGIAVFSVKDVKADELEHMKVTCYCPESCPGKITATGTQVRYGVAATEEHIGDCAAVYYRGLDDNQMWFLGYFSCEDRIGSRSPYVIDIWTENIEDAKQIMTITRGDVYIRWIECPKG